MKEDISSLREDMENMETSLREDVNGMKKDVSSLREDMTNLKGEIHLALENEIVPNINIIAEGHLELSRKLNECIHISRDIKAKQEIQDVFINLHKYDGMFKVLG